MKIEEYPFSDPKHFLWLLIPHMVALPLLLLYQYAARPLVISLPPEPGYFGHIVWLDSQWWFHALVLFGLIAGVGAALLVQSVLKHVEKNEVNWIKQSQIHEPEEAGRAAA